jgi:hypothetical protein
MRKRGGAVARRELTTILTTTMTTVGRPDTSIYTKRELVSCLVSHRPVSTDQMVESLSRKGPGRRRVAGVTRSGPPSFAASTIWSRT